MPWPGRTARSAAPGAGGRADPTQTSSVRCRRGSRSHDAGDCRVGRHERVAQRRDSRRRRDRRASNRGRCRRPSRVVLDPRATRRPSGVQRGGHTIRGAADEWFAPHAADPAVTSFSGLCQNTGSASTPRSRSPCKWTTSCSLLVPSTRCLRVSTRGGSVSISTRCSRKFAHSRLRAGSTTSSRARRTTSRASRRTSARSSPIVHPSPGSTCTLAAGTTPTTTSFPVCSRG